MGDKVQLDPLKYRGVFDYPCVRGKNLLASDDEAANPANTSKHVLAFTGWGSQRKSHPDENGERNLIPDYSGNPNPGRVLDQRKQWMQEWSQKGRFKQREVAAERAVSTSAQKSNTSWTQTGMDRSNDQFDLGAPGHPCSICQREARHKHAYRPGDKPQIDTENLKPVDHTRNETFMVDDRPIQITISAGAIYESVRKWAVSPEPWSYKRMMGSERGRYRIVPQVYSSSPYNHSDEGDGSDDNGVAAYRAPHKTHRQDRGDDDSPERLENVYPVRGTPSAAEFNAHFRDIGPVSKMLEAVKYVLTHESDANAHKFSSVFNITQVRATIYDQMEREQLVIPNDLPPVFGPVIS